MQETLSICISKTKEISEEQQSLLDKFAEKLKTASLEEVQEVLKASDLVHSATRLGKRLISPSTTSSTASSLHDPTIISSDSDSTSHSRASSTSVPPTKKTQIGSPNQIHQPYRTECQRPKSPSPKSVSPPTAKTSESSTIKPTSSIDRTPARKIRIEKSTATITSDVSSQPAPPLSDRIVKLKPRQDTSKTNSLPSLIPSTYPREPPFQIHAQDHSDLNEPAVAPFRPPQQQLVPLTVPSLQQFEKMMSKTTERMTPAV